MEEVKMFGTDTIISTIINNLDKSNKRTVIKVKF